MKTLTFDPPTFMLAASLTAFLSAGFSVLAARSTTRSEPCTVDWALGMLALGFACLLWYLTTILPTWVSFVLANGLVTLAPLYLLSAIYKFGGEKSPLMLSAGLFGLGVSGVVLVYFFGHARELAVATIAIVHFMFAVLGIRKLRQYAASEKSWFFSVLCAVLVGISLVPLARVSEALFGAGAEAVSPVASSKVQGLAIVLATFLVIAGSFGFVGLVSDRARNRTLELANRDGLTGLLSRRAFYDRAQAILAKSTKPMIVLMVDVDHFKKINDMHGHLVGDRVIQHVARLLQRTSRNVDLVGRYGGEEFCILLPDCGAVEGRQIAERFVHEARTQPVRLAQSEFLPWTLSVGFVAVERIVPPIRLENLISAADDALYLAKRNGRDQAQQHQGDLSAMEALKFVNSTPNS